MLLIHKKSFPIEFFGSRDGQTKWTYWLLLLAVISQKAVWVSLTYFISHIIVIDLLLLLPPVLSFMASSVKVIQVKPIVAL